MNSQNLLENSLSKQKERVMRLTYPGKSTRMLVQFILIAVLIIMVLPFAWMSINAFKTASDFLRHPFSLIPKTVTLENFVNSWTQGKVGVYIFNSFLYAISVVIAQLILDSLAAYGFARVKFPGRDMLFYLVLGTMMLPMAVRVIPQYLAIYEMGLVNSYLGVVSPAFAQAFGIFMLRQFFLNIPLEVEDAAIVDGCNRFQIYLQIILPMSKPALLTLGLFLFIFQWNSFLWPLVVLSDWTKYPITVGIALFREATTLHWELVFAATTFSSAPLICLFLGVQKYLIGGIQLSGLKG